MGREDMSLYQPFTASALTVPQTCAPKAKLDKYRGWSLVKGNALPRRQCGRYMCVENWLKLGTTGIPHFIVLHFIALHRWCFFFSLQIKGKTVYQHKNCNLLHVVVWDHLEPDLHYLWGVQTPTIGKYRESWSFCWWKTLPSICKGCNISEVR